MGDALIDVCFFFTGIVLLSGTHVQSFKETFFSCTVDFKVYCYILPEFSCIVTLSE